MVEFYQIPTKSEPKIQLQITILKKTVTIIHCSCSILSQIRLFSLTTALNPKPIDWKIHHMHKTRLLDKAWKINERMAGSGVPKNYTGQKTWTIII